MDHNIARLRDRLAFFKVGFRPHLKTAKSVEVGRRLMTTPRGPAMVSTLREAEVFANSGVVDMIYGVGIAPHKLERIKILRRAGADIAVVVDSVEQANAVAESSDPGDPIPALIEVDCDGHRSGVAPGNTELLVAISSALAPAAELRGVLTLHADQDVGAIVWSPLAWGRLTGKITRRDPIPDVSRLHGTEGSAPPVRQDLLFDVVEVLQDIAHETGRSVPQIALNWLLARASISSVLVGARNETQLRDNLQAVDWQLSAEQRARLDLASEITPIYPYWHHRKFPERSVI